MILSPKASGKYIAENATHVKINRLAVDKLAQVIAEELDSGRLKPANFSQAAVHPKPEYPQVFDWLFVVDTLNFCFWHHEDLEGWKVEGYSGYYALCAAINRALNENVDILNPRYYSTITEVQLKKVLRSDTKVEVPMLPERTMCLREVGAVLLEKFEGTFENVVKQAGSSAKTLLKLIVSNFKCFQDEGIYKGQPVSYYKRAQILIGDVWACFQGEGLGQFDDLDEITMFADYRVPQTLLWFGVLEYSDTLNNFLKEKQPMLNGDDKEQEIRGCSIHAVEMLKKQINQGREYKINSILIDHFLWDFRRKHADEIKEKGLPFHKVYCIYY